jgi:hypothetical protein
MMELYLHSPIRLHGVVLHQLSTGTTLPLFTFHISKYFPEGERSPHEADHSPPSGAEAKNAWIYTFTPPYFFKV